jgi:hypothetical protein
MTPHKPHSALVAVSWLTKLHSTVAKMLTGLLLPPLLVLLLFCCCVQAGDGRADVWRKFSFYWCGC